MVRSLVDRTFQLSLVRAPALVVRDVRRAAEAMEPVARLADEALDEGPVGELDVPTFVLTLSV